MSNLLILTDGGDSIGFGHIMRCLAIKECWRHGSAKLLVQMKGESKTPDGALNYDWLDHIDSLKKFTSKNTSLLVDSYQTNADHFHQLSEIFPFITVLDDYNRMIYPVDLLICPGVYGKEINYSNQVAKTYGGPEYVIIRPEILSLTRVKIKNTVQRVLVTLGGSQQSTSLFQMIIDTFENTDYQLIIVTGNTKLATGLSSKTAIIHGVLDGMEMANLMTSIDIAITAAGQTLNELSWLGVPIFTIKTGEDQHYNWNYYGQHGLSFANKTQNCKNLQQALIETFQSQNYINRCNSSYKLKKLLTATGTKLICNVINNNRNAHDE